ncbi:hypothetical protein ACGFIX_14395 [Nocardia salmonicida]|uniref:hypothetical protein n=1 Tax=Nocardia salmonicida TaxID=53431 RepID=UPI0037207185
MSDFSNDTSISSPCLYRAGYPFCVAEATRERFVSIARTVTARLRRGGLDTPWRGSEAMLEVGYRVALLAEDPRYAFQFDRCLDLLDRAAQCSVHYADDQRRVAAAASGPRNVRRVRVVPARLRTAMLAYLAADVSHRPTAAKEVTFHLDVAVKDFGRSYLAETSFTARPARKLGALRAADNAVLFTAIEVAVADYLVRGVVFGEPIAARIMLGRCADYEAVEYLRRVSAVCASRVVADLAAVLSDVQDAEILAALAVIRDCRSWQRGKLDTKRLCRAEALYDELIGWSHELLVGSLDEYVERTGLDVVAPGQIPAYSATQYLTLLKSVRRTRSWQGRRLSPAQCRRVETEIAAHEA